MWMDLSSLKVIKIGIILKNFHDLRVEARLVFLKQIDFYNIE